MDPEVIVTRYGRPALDALRRAVAAAKVTDVLSPVTVVVPSNHVGVTARRHLATRGLPGLGSSPGPTAVGSGIAGVTFATPYRLAELLGAPRLAAAGRRPVSTPVVAAALRRSLAEDPGMFAAVAAHPATETALVNAFGELSDVSEAGLAALAGAGGRARDVVAIVQRARRALSTGWYDEAHLADAAVAAVEADDPAALALGTVVVHLPQDLLRRQARLVAAVAARRPTTVVAGTTGDERADAGIARTLDRLGCARPPGLRAGPTGDPPPSGAVGPNGSGGSGAYGTAPTLPVGPATTRVITTSDADEEVRVAVQAVVDAMRAGTPLERIAVLHPTPRPYGRSLHEHLTAAGIPLNGTAVRPLAASVLGATLLGLLALPDHGFRRRDLLDLLTRSSPRGADGRRAPTASWERLSREAGVVHGRDDWARLVERLAVAFDTRADTLADHVRAARAQGASDDEIDRLERRVTTQQHLAAQARDLRRTALQLVDSLSEAAAGKHTWAERVAWLRHLADGLVGRERRAGDWPTDEQRAADKIDQALDRLADLDAVDAAPSLDVFRRTLELELEADLGRVGRFGVGVLVAPLSFAVGLDLDLVVVVGMAEGSLPATVHDDSLLPDGERFLTGGELPLRRERTARDHRRLLAALAAAERHVLCAPRGDLRASNERVASRWLIDIVEALGGQRVAADRLLDVDAPWAHHVPSFAHAVRHAPFPPTAQHHRLRTGLAGLDDPVAAAGAQVIGARRSRAFTRFDGNLAGAPVPSPIDEIVSSTRLESWASCPHAYFVRHLLGVEPVEDPDRQLTITALDKGSLVHEVLERFVVAVLARAAGDGPPPDRPWTRDDRDLMHEIASEVCDRFEAEGRTGRPVFWRRDRAQLLALAQRFLDEDDAVRRAERCRPYAAELDFGRGGRVGPVELPLPDGRHVRFRGSADRIDVADDGTLHVIDYKTGRSDGYRGLSAENPDEQGTRLQLTVYGLAARIATGRHDAPVAARYWFVSERGRFKRYGYEVDDAVVARVGDTVATIVDGIGRGVFPARPVDDGGPFIPCSYCDPDGLGVADLRRDWERKRDDPSMAEYAQLADPRADEVRTARPAGGVPAPQAEGTSR